MEGIQSRETEAAREILCFLQKVLIGIDPDLDQIEVGAVQEDLSRLSMKERLGEDLQTDKGAGNKDSLSVLDNCKRPLRDSIASSGSGDEDS